MLQKPINPGFLSELSSGEKFYCYANANFQLLWARILRGQKSWGGKQLVEGCCANFLFQLDENSRFMHFFQSNVVEIYHFAYF